MPSSRFLVPSLELEEISAYQSDVDAALRLYFSEAAPTFQNRFGEKSREVVSALLASRIEESDLRSSLMVLTSLEACFRLDFDVRCRRRLKDPLSEYFRDVVKERGDRVRLDEDILVGWKQHTSAPSTLISTLRNAFKYRHWVAHGRYWTPKFGRRYDFASVYLMAEAIIEEFPLEV
jgi:hypothetical protein